MAEAKTTDTAAAARAAVEASDEQKRKIVEEVAKRTDGVRPTPTQRECDLAVLGQPVLEKDDDGSGPDPRVKSLEPKAGASGGYQTRDVRASGSSGATQHRSHSTS